MKSYSLTSEKNHSNWKYSRGREYGWSIYFTITISIAERALYRNPHDSRTIDDQKLLSQEDCQKQEEIIEVIFHKSMDLLIRSIPNNNST